MGYVSGSSGGVGAIGVVNVGGGGGTATFVGTSSQTIGGLDLGIQNNAGTTVANVLTNGTMELPRIYTGSASATSGTQIFNFNGGTLKARPLNFGNTFMTDTDIDAVTVYSNGGTIDNNGTSITIGRQLS